VEQIVDIVEVGEVGVYLNDPVWYREADCADVKPAHLLRQEGFTLNPRDDVVHDP
jgi:hypothetical protein